MHFDDWKCYFKNQKPTEADLTKYEMYELTFALDYNAQRRYSRCAQSYSKLDISKWRLKLGLPTFEVTKSTLVNTSQLDRPLESETRE